MKFYILYIEDTVNKEGVEPQFVLQHFEELPKAFIDMNWKVEEKSTIEEVTTRLEELNINWEEKYFCGFLPKPGK